MSEWMERFFFNIVEVVAALGLSPPTIPLYTQTDRQTDRQEEERILVTILIWKKRTGHPFYLLSLFFFYLYTNSPLFYQRKKEQQRRMETKEPPKHGADNEIPLCVDFYGAPSLLSQMKKEV